MYSTSILRAQQSISTDFSVELGIKKQKSFPEKTVQRSIHAPTSNPEINNDHFTAMTAISNPIRRLHYQDQYEPNGKLSQPSHQAHIPVSSLPTDP
jgi:hypothetical protein